jgi:hypothetical protein
MQNPAAILVALRPFTRNDWYGFAGAECFADGSEPLIGIVTTGGAETCVIVDAAGVSFNFANEDGDFAAWMLAIPAKAAAIAIANAALPRLASLSTIGAVGEVAASLGLDRIA